MNNRRRVWPIAVVVVLILAAAWALLADRDAVYTYVGPNPPRADSESPAASLALILGGGGPRGFAHIGVLKVLHEEGIRPDLIVGTSMGAIVGAAYARRGGPGSLEQDLLSIDPPWWRDLTFARRPWLKGDLLEAQLRTMLDNALLESLPVRIFAVATHVETGAPVAFSRGDAAAALRASAAVPGVFKRVGIAGQEYFDGDISAPVPVGVARAQGARIIIAVDVMSHPAGMPYEMRDHPDLMLSDFYRHAINRGELVQADVVIQPELGYYIGTSIGDRQRAIAAGERAARAALPAVRAAMQPYPLRRAPPCLMRRDEAPGMELPTNRLTLPSW